MPCCDKGGFRQSLIFTGILSLRRNRTLVSFMFAKVHGNQKPKLLKFSPTGLGSFAIQWVLPNGSLQIMQWSKGFQERSTNHRPVILDIISLPYFSTLMPPPVIKPNKNSRLEAKVHLSSRLEATVYSIISLGGNCPGSKNHTCNYAWWSTHA